MDRLFRLTLPLAALLPWLLPAQPTVSANIYPNSGDGISQTFTIVASDSAGYTDIQWIRLLVGSNLQNAPKCWIGLNLGYGDGTTGVLWLANDDASQWSSVPISSSGGPQTQMSNSYCSFWANQTTLTHGQNTEVLTIPLTFTANFAGKQPLVPTMTTKEGNNGGSSQGLDNGIAGTWTVDPNGGTPDFQISVAPSYQYVTAGVAVPFSINVTELNGFTGQVSCAVSGLPPNVTADTNCGTYQPASTAQSSYTITTSPSTTVGTYTVTFTGSSGGLTHQVPVTLFVQSKNVYNWINPTSGSGSSIASFTIEGIDTAGYTDLNGVDMLMNSTYSSANACWLYQDNNQRLWLANDDASNWTYVTPGSTAVIQNSQCWISGTTYSVNANGNSLAGTLTLNFNPSFAGAKTIFVQTVEQPSNFDGYKVLGSWTVTTGGTGPGQPYTTSVSPSSGSGSTATFTLTATDSSGYTNLNGVDMLINASYNNVNACWLYLDESEHLWLANDDISNWTYVGAGSSSVIQNSQCSVSGTSFSANESGSTLTGTFTVSFTPPFAGAKTIYLQSVDAAGNQRGYTTQGTWTVQ